VLETKSTVSQFAEVIAKHLLIQIAERVERFNTDICALESALEQAPEVFESVGVNLPINVAFRVVDYLMLEILMLQALIGKKRVSVDRAASFHMAANLGLNDMLAASGNEAGANFATTFENAHHSGFVFGASLGNAALALVSVHEASSAAVESLICFDFGAAPPI